MLFNSLTFLVFFAVVLPVFLLMKDWKWQKYFLLAASYVFYAAWHPPYTIILFASTLLDWYLARRIAGAVSLSRRKVLLLISLTANLGLLATFKYADFLMAGFREVAQLANVHYLPPDPGLLLPVGISFYTFASLSYTIDVYRREIRSDTSFTDYALFVSFFPHLVAGPIVRASYLLPQIATPRRPTQDQITWGLVLLILGIFCKAVLADSILAPTVDAIYAAPESYPLRDVWLGVLAFSGQIFYDFSGYSLCAIGIALCFGFSFPDNFHFPYAAAGFTDFWRRWHISLSTWLRDYLYVPLGGNRHGSAKTYRNLMLTMLIGGLWHGASWMFVIWGALHGIYLAIERWWQRRPGTRPASGRVSSLYVLFTFLVVTLTWIPFRASSMASVAEVFQGLFGPGAGLTLDAMTRLLCVLVMVLTLVGQFKLRSSSLEQFFATLRFPVQVLMVALALIAIFLCSGGDERAFIYFQF
ncbi:MAG: MBOAT family protein [bacterium]|nr:MBOAT family protein [bacterium]